MFKTDVHQSRNSRRRSECLVVLLVLGLVITNACSEAPVAERFVGPTVVFAPPPAVLVDVTFTGQILDRDHGTPVAGADVSTRRVSGVDVTVPTTVITDNDGRFEITLQVPETWRSGSFVVSREGYEPAWLESHRSDFKPLRLGMYPTVLIRPGESIETGLVEPRLGDSSSYYCGFGIDDDQCRRIVVDAPSGEAVEIELIPHGGLERVGLIDAAQQPASAKLERRITVTRGEVWVAGNFGPVTLRASLR